MGKAASGRCSVLVAALLAVATVAFGLVTLEMVQEATRELPAGDSSVCGGDPASFEEASRAAPTRKRKLQRRRGKPSSRSAAGISAFSPPSFGRLPA